MLCTAHGRHRRAARRTGGAPSPRHLTRAIAATIADASVIGQLRADVCCRGNAGEKRSRFCRSADLHEAGVRLRSGLGGNRRAQRAFQAAFDGSSCPHQVRKPDTREMRSPGRSRDQHAGGKLRHQRRVRPFRPAIKLADLKVPSDEISSAVLPGRCRRYDCGCARRRLSGKSPPDAPPSPGCGSRHPGAGHRPQITEAWGQQVIVENRPGAQAPRRRVVVRADPDGYTLISSRHIRRERRALQRSTIPSGGLRRLMIGTTPLVLMVHPSMHVGLEGFSALARASAA